MGSCSGTGAGQRQNTEQGTRSPEDSTAVMGLPRFSCLAGLPPGPQAESQIARDKFSKQL